MSHFIDESGVSHYMFNVLREDFGIFKSFMSTHPMTDYDNFEEFVHAIRRCLYDKHCRSVIFPYTFDEWQLFYDKALTKELKKCNSILYQNYNINSDNTTIDHLQTNHINVSDGGVLNANRIQ